MSPDYVIVSALVLGLLLGFLLAGLALVIGRG